MPSPDTVKLPRNFADTSIRLISVITRTAEERLPLPRTMLGPLVLNTLALARWVGQSAGSPQYYPRYNSTRV